MKKIFLFSACALALASCGGSGSDAESDPNVLMHTDFESVDGWLPADLNSTLTHEKAHSGKTSIKVDGAHEYSLAFSKPFGQLHESRPKKIKVSAWTFVPDAQAAASLVISINDPATPDKPVLWQALELGKESKPYGEWKEVSQTITVPANVGPNNKLGFYLWRTSGSRPVYADDFKVTLVE
ncbi:carbohydrate binding domain-containing protein [Hymenobacter daeguensis]